MFALYWPKQQGEPPVRRGKVATSLTQALARLMRAPKGATIRTYPDNVTLAVRGLDRILTLNDYL